MSAADTSKEVLFEREVQTGIFEVRSNGEVWRLKWPRTPQRNTPRRAERTDSRGYLQIQIGIGGRRRTGVLAHRAVWYHFYGAIPIGMVVNHLNGNKADNRPENLEVCTHSQNQKHAFQIGLKSQFGERNPFAKLTAQQVLQIRASYMRGASPVDLSMEYSVTSVTIRDIVNLRYWKTVAVTPEYLAWCERKGR